MLAPRTSLEAVLAVAAVTAAATIAIGAYSAQSQLFGTTLIAGRDPNEAALTYDDGPNDAVTPALLELLAERNVHATFFMIGRFVRQRPDLVRQVHAAGHLIGNHTETHPWLTWKAAGTIREELHACNAALEDAIGGPVKFVRFPHGARRPATIRIARELGLTPVQWNALAYDWKPITADAMLANTQRGIVRNRRQGRGSNILLHDGFDLAQGADRNPTLQVTARLLEGFSQQGIRTVTVDAWV